ncbi:protein tyrosine phosphatase [Candidatus Woesearchaeota archaeon]|nr:protein tyrosine phosphatase [Candidatus Woesearchaeota archaeon]
MKLLFVCTGNLDRSPTAEELFKGEHETKSCGISLGAPVRLTKNLITWADKVFCMEKIHEEIVLQLCPEAKNKTIVLGITDSYFKNDPKLKEELKEKVEKHLTL